MADNQHAATDGPLPGQSLEVRIAATGNRLLQGLGPLVEAACGGATDRGPIAMSRRLKLDKVLASRLLRAVASNDPMAAMHRMPGPEPLRRVLKACEKLGINPALLTPAREAVDGFDELIRTELGDRAALDTVVAAWVPEARREFELRRKQAAFRAVSELRGVRVETLVSTVLLAPNPEREDRIDVVWVSCLLGLQRLRPNATVKVVSRRIGHPPAGAAGGSERQTVTLDGGALGEEPEGVCVREFCSSPLPTLDVERRGEVAHVMLAGRAFGPASVADLVVAERSPADLPRRVPPLASGRERRAYFFAEMSTPATRAVFDVLVDRSLWPGQAPRLDIYDTSFEGVASVNDPSRDVDRLDLGESAEALGEGIDRARVSGVPRYAELLAHVCGKAGFDPRRFRGFRSTIEYPLYGSQVTMSFVAEQGAE